MIGSAIKEAVGAVVLSFDLEMIVDSFAFVIVIVKQNFNQEPPPCSKFPISIFLSRHLHLIFPKSCTEKQQTMCLKLTRDDPFWLHLSQTT